MHNTGTWYFFERGMIQQCIEQCPALITVAWMHHKTRLLIEHDQCFILEKDIERNGLRN